jgi:hypothetical protein
MTRKQAEQAGLGFETFGTLGKIFSPYYSGSPLMQIKGMADATRALWSIDRKVLVIGPKSGTRQVGTLDVSPISGLVGYPMFSDNGIIVKTEYQFPVSWLQSFHVKSSIQKANATWRLYKHVYNLESQMPRGHWFVWLYGDLPQYDNTQPDP